MKVGEFKKLLSTLNDDEDIVIKISCGYKAGIKLGTGQKEFDRGKIYLSDAITTLKDLDENIKVVNFLY